MVGQRLALIKRHAFAILLLLVHAARRRRSHASKTTAAITASAAVPSSADISGTDGGLACAYAATVDAAKTSPDVRIVFIKHLYGSVWFSPVSWRYMAGRLIRPTNSMSTQAVVVFEIDCKDERLTIVDRIQQHADLVVRTDLKIGIRDGKVEDLLSIT